MTIDWSMLGAIAVVVTAIVSVAMGVLNLKLEPIRQLVQEKINAANRGIEAIKEMDIRVRELERRVDVIEDREDRHES